MNGSVDDILFDDDIQTDKTSEFQHSQTELDFWEEMQRLNILGQYQT